MVHIQLVDPAAYTPPYDHALAAALSRAGVKVELVTAASPQWDTAIAASLGSGHEAEAGSYERRLDFCRHGAGWPTPWRQLARGLQHPRAMRALSRSPADITHLQWTPLQELDRFLLPTGRPLVITAHDILPREGRPSQRAAQAAIYRRADAVITHSEHGRRRLLEEASVDPRRVTVIPHGAFTHLARTPREPLPAELAAAAAQGGKIVLSFGLIRPYKGTDALLRAWRGVPGDAQLWIVGRPRGVDEDELRELADARVHFVTRFVTDGELASCFDAADLAVLPYRAIEQSGVLAIALAFGVPVLATAVGAFPEAAALGAARTVAPGDEPALAAAISELLGDDAACRQLAAGARALADGEWSWDEVARRHIEVYRGLLR